MTQAKSAQSLSNAQPWRAQLTTSRTRKSFPVIGQALPPDFLNLPIVPGRRMEGLR